MACDAFLAPPAPRLASAPATGSSVFLRGHGFARVVDSGAHTNGDDAALRFFCGDGSADEALGSGDAAKRSSVRAEPTAAAKAPTWKLVAVLGRGDATASPALLICGRTDTFRALARSQVGIGTDSVLEIGCSFGQATRILAPRAASMCAVDVSASTLRRAALAVACPSCRFVRLDAVRHAAELLVLAVEVAPAAIFVDLGGDRDAAPVTRVVDRLLNCVAIRGTLRVVVVKCRELYAWAQREQLGRCAPRAGQAAVAGALPSEFWADALAAWPQHAAGEHAAPSAPAEPAAAGGPAASTESRLCFEFLNLGRCDRANCSFRHLLPTHPDAVADAARRERVGRLPGWARC